MKGFDLDGVVTLGIYPGPDDVIVSGRSIEEAHATLGELRARGIKNQVFFAPWSMAEKSRRKSGEWKARVIGIMFIQTFFEDDPVQARVIRQRCPGICLVTVNGVGKK